MYALLCMLCVAVLSHSILPKMKKLLLFLLVSTDSTAHCTAQQIVQNSTIQRSVEMSTPHTPHAESAIRHVKNEAHSTALNLPYALPTRWLGALLTFVVRTINMEPRSNAPHHMSAYIRPLRAVHRHTPSMYRLYSALPASCRELSNPPVTQDSPVATIACGSVHLNLLFMLYWLHTCNPYLIFINV
jgi:hypothetical protein